MFFRHFMLDLIRQEVNIFLMGNEATGRVLMVDAGGYDPAIVDCVEEHDLTVTDILITHAHWDHIDHLGDYLASWPEATVHAPIALDAAPDAQIVAEGDRLSAAGFEFLVYQTSGHTPDSISYYCEAQALCFVGDAIFAGALGGTADDTLYAEQKKHVLEKLMTLPEPTELLSGHGPVTTVAIERKGNPFLRPGFGRTG